MSFSLDFFFDEPADSEEYLPNLLEAMSQELIRHLPEEKFLTPYKPLIEAVQAAVDSYDPDTENVEAHEHLLDLQDQLLEALNEIAPPYVFFALDNTGRWRWQIDEFDLESSEVRQVSDLSELEDNYDGEVLVVNDHGNRILLNVNGNDVREIWSTV